LNLFISYRCELTSRAFDFHDLPGLPCDNNGKEIEIALRKSIRVFERERLSGLWMTWLVGSDENFNCVGKISGAYPF